MATRAKFKLDSYETSLHNKPVRQEDGSTTYELQEVRTLVLHPVFSDVPGSENKKFWDATPTGEIRLGVVNQAAWRNFDIGKEYYVDFSPAE